MTQMAIILATPQQVPRENPPESNNQNVFPLENEFAPHLANAVAEVTETNPAIPADLTTTVEIQTSTAADLFANIPTQSIDLPETTLAETINDIKPISTGTEPTETIAIAFAAGNMQNVINATFSSVNQPTATGHKLAFSTENKGEILKGELPDTLRETAKISVLQPQSPGINSNLPLKVEISVNGTQLQPAPASPFTKNSTVLEQLQLIINNSNETGTVSIAGTINKYSLQSPGETEPKLTGFVFSQLHEAEKITDKPNLKNSTLRQDINGQYIEAKLNAREHNNSGSTPDNTGQQSNSNSEQLSSSTPSQNQTLVQEQSSSYQQVSTAVQDIQNQQTQNIAKSVTLPSGTVVYEDDVIQQVIERFQIIRKPDDTRLSMKLHPAELGELKIDITVREGSIKAHVIAQSQHVQEMVERNMAKLRNILEDQGFTIEELLVTSESDSVNDFNLFEQNLSHRNDYTSPNVETKSKNGFNSILENAVEDVSVTTTGVNITA